MVIWTDKFTTGSSPLDQQHQTLIDNINYLEQLLLVSNPSRQESEAMIELVDFLELYADKHFKCEEQCMERFRCPSHATNKQSHERFLRFFQDFKQVNQAEGFRHEILAQLHSTVSQWIGEHILRIDTQLKPCIKG
jgi:hemerythrin